MSEELDTSTATLTPVSDTATGAQDTGKTADTTTKTQVQTSDKDASKVTDKVVTADNVDKTAKEDEIKTPDWRETYAKGDEKKFKQLQRYASPEAVADALFAAQKKISSGELKAPLAKDAKPEDVAAWRIENGIPEKPADYYSSLSDGLVIGEADKPIFDKIVTAMHGVNASPAAVNAMASAYYEMQADSTASMAEEDKRYAKEAEDALRAEWGNDYRGNQNTITNFLESAPEGIKDRLLGGSLADGRLIKDDASMQRWLISMAREINPASTVVPGSTGNPAGAIDDEIKTIEGRMSTDRDNYFKDTKAQARYLELITAREKIKARK